jgi:CheY-like chemotaxis protein
LAEESIQPVVSAKAKRLRVVIADDDRDAVMTLSALLEHEGHEVREVYRGSEVLRMVRDFDPDVALLDISMPGMTGYDVAREIRQVFGERRPTLVAVTGWKKTSDRILAQIAGFDHHLAKPFEPEALLDLLQTVKKPAGVDPLKR